MLNEFYSNGFPEAEYFTASTMINMYQHLTKTILLPFDGAVKRVTEEFENEGFSLINSIPVETTTKNLKMELHPYGVYYPCNVVVTEVDTATTQVTVSDQLGGVAGIGLELFAREIRSIIELAMAAL